MTDPTPTSTRISVAAASAIGCEPIRAMPPILAALDGISIMTLQSVTESESCRSTAVADCRRAWFLAARVPAAVLATVVRRRLSTIAIEAVIDAVWPVMHGDNHAVRRRHRSRIKVGGTIIVGIVDDERTAIHVLDMTTNMDVRIGGKRGRGNRQQSHHRPESQVH